MIAWDRATCCPGSAGGNPWVQPVLPCFFRSFSLPVRPRSLMLSALSRLPPVPERALGVFCSSAACRTVGAAVQEACSFATFSELGVAPMQGLLSRRTPRSQSPMPLIEGGTTQIPKSLQSASRPMVRCRVQGRIGGGGDGAHAPPRAVASPVAARARMRLWTLKPRRQQWTSSMTL